MFTPSRLAISDITRSNPAVVTTSTDHELTTGQAVRINIPTNYGMTELSGKIYSITVIASNTFSLQYSQVPPAVNVNSSNFTAFIPSPASDIQFTAEVIPVGSKPSPNTSTIPLNRNNFCETLIADATTNISTSPIPF